MLDKTDYPIYKNNSAVAEHYHKKIQNKRVRRVICDYKIDENNEFIFIQKAAMLEAFGVMGTHPLIASLLK